MVEGGGCEFFPLRKIRSHPPASRAFCGGAIHSSQIKKKKNIAGNKRVLSEAAVSCRSKPANRGGGGGFFFSYV